MQKSFGATSGFTRGAIFKDGKEWKLGGINVGKFIQLNPDLRVNYDSISETRQDVLGPNNDDEN